MSMQYKILTQKDPFSGNFEPEKLETTINSFAQEGWRVVAATTGRIPGFGDSRDEMIIVMERAA